MLLPPTFCQSAGARVRVVDVAMQPSPAGGPQGIRTEPVAAGPNCELDLKPFATAVVVAGAPDDASTTIQV